MILTTGFLVVLQDRGTQFGPGLNPRYRGVYRMPMWPSTVPGENAALESYVFDLRNDDGLLPDLPSAIHLLANLSQSPRQFEVIHCQFVSGSPGASTEGCRALGYDVVIWGDFLSLVGCFPKQDVMVPHLARLNEEGLFRTYAEAEAFRRDYVALRLPEWDAPFRVVLVELVVL